MIVDMKAGSDIFAEYGVVKISISELIVHSAVTCSLYLKQMLQTAFAALRH